MDADEHGFGWPTEYTDDTEGFGCPLKTRKGRKEEGMLFGSRGGACSWRH